MDIQEQFYQKLMIFKISPWLKNSIFKEYWVSTKQSLFEADLI